jgi:hypothetical protein
MPKFIDFHAKMPAMPPGAMDEVKSNLGKVDANGVKAINAFFTKDGQAYCISEAPNADAVCRAHEAKGLPLGKGDVHEISTSLA